MKRPKKQKAEVYPYKKKEETIHTLTGDPDLDIVDLKQKGVDSREKLLTFIASVTPDNFNLKGVSIDAQGNETETKLFENQETVEGYKKTFIRMVEAIA